ncbi:hypothetical protein [Saccharopolyspora taberi]|uniref:hypothetical protein n=1 Tax=Saccharopolyspora taberi TaxID=60895 RepID=UPI0031E41424
MRKTLLRYRPSLIVIEWSSTLLRRAASTNEVEQFLADIGYARSERLADHNALFFPAGTDRTTPWGGNSRARQEK